MADSIEIDPANGPVRGRICPPGSKSLTNRALVCAALAEGVSTLRGALHSEDTEVMIAGLQALGIGIEVADQGEILRIVGSGGVIPAEQADLWVANSGTTMRFLTAVATLGQGTYRLDGIKRMRERPIGDLTDALRQLGAEVRCESAGQCPPVVVDGHGLAGGAANMRGDISSQFLSSLLMAAPCARQAVSVRIEGELVSVPYVAMTLQVMNSFGVDAEATDSYRKIVVPSSSSYQGCDYRIEPDASAASYFLAAAAVTGGEVTIEGLGRDSLQGDVAFADCLEQMGCDVRFDSRSITVVGRPLAGIEVDMNAISDTVQTLAVVALFAKGPTLIRNVGHIRHKETDRLAALANELRKLGAQVIENRDGLEIVPGELQAAAIETYNDHRMAMSFALAGLGTPGVVILDPGCVAKTYPRYFEDLSSLLGSDV